MDQTIAPSAEANGRCRLRDYATLFMVKDQDHSPQSTSVFSVKPRLEKTTIDVLQLSKKDSPENEFTSKASDAQKQTRLDTKRHESWKRKKAKGLNNKILKEVSTHTKRLQSEGRKETKTAAQLVGGK